MLKKVKGNLLECDAEALTNAVNCVGVMARGIALQFKRMFPENYDAYMAACLRGEVRVGKMFLYRMGPQQSRLRFIINFPTKNHWREKSRLEHIERGLADLLHIVRAEAIQSIAIPPLGCGAGGLDWILVRPRIEASFLQVPEVTVHLFEPE